MKKLVLAGGGHAQLSVLHALAQYPGELKTILVTPSRYQMYSGMLPGWMAGHYTLEECRIDLLPLADKAGVEVKLMRLTGIIAAQQRVHLSDGSQLEYDLLSLDVGSEINTARLQAAGERLLPVKPLETFVQQWPHICEAAAQRDGYRLVIVGGGAAGVELAFAAHHAFRARGLKAEVALVASAEGLLPGHANGVRNRVLTLLQQRGITFHKATALGEEGGLYLSTGAHLATDSIIAATGARPASWLAQTDLMRDEQGYVLVDAQHRSVSHPNVLAAGDACIRTDVRLPRSGVHAVFAGPVLAHNLLADLGGRTLQRYCPRRKSLYLLATGPQHAIASWGAFSAQGHWVWRWKNWIDRRFMRKHGVLAKGTN
ncbi:FAD-dependent oxidoreductase [Ferrigenium sp. UT5]|uniref:FAD-dependent oxidoreductase n=1 Tax=Ferrigenium sp. UT5 TaxID=3242105 RepID=UPI003553F2B4